MPPEAAAPSFAAGDNVPLCATGSDPAALIRQKEELAAQLQLSTKLAATIDVWNGCLQVTTYQNGDPTVTYYDPDSLRVIAVY